MILGEDPKHDSIISRIVTFSLVCPISMPAALRRPQKKHAPGILEHVPCVCLSIFVVFCCLECDLVAIWSLFVGFGPNALTIGVSMVTHKNIDTVDLHKEFPLLPTAK